MSTLLTTTPRDDGFWMPGEFDPHAGCWMLWPQRPDVWRESAKFAQAAFAATAAAIAQFEPVTVGASTDQYLNARRQLPEAVRVVELAANDAWMRDCGPTFVVNGQGEVRGVDWEFNAWGGELGGLYAEWDKDNLVAQKVLAMAGASRYKAPCVVEGGAIHVDGAGTLITTASCLLNPNRNPDYSKAEMESLLMAYTGCRKVIWLAFESYEETDGHVDGLCAFVRPGVLLVDWCDDPARPEEYRVCRQVYDQLAAATDAAGRSFELHRLPSASPAPLSEAEAGGVVPTAGIYAREAGFPIGGTYVNFYLANGGVVMPTYDDPQDAVAQRIVADCFPERQVVGVPAREIAIGGGMVHCITQQQPLAVETDTPVEA